MALRLIQLEYIFTILRIKTMKQILVLRNHTIHIVCEPEQDKIPTESNSVMAGISACEPYCTYNQPLSQLNIYSAGWKVSLGSPTRAREKALT